MIFKPQPLSMTLLDDGTLVEDKQRCRRIGPCGVGRKALYLNSFFIDRRYYVPLSAVTRVYKRVAMSKGGFTGKGVFASMAYLVVEYDGGKEQACNFKYEDQVDELLQILAREHPEIPCVSAAAEQRIAAERARREAEERSRPPISVSAKREIEELQQAIDYLECKPELYKRLSRMAKRRRNYQCTSASYRWAAMAITLLGAAALIYGIVSLACHSAFAVYFLLFGLAAIFMFAGFSVLPTARNNRTTVMRGDEQARAQMEAYLNGFPGFPLPARYAHPIVLRRMQRAIADGRATDAGQALKVVKADLKSLNADVQVSQEEYDEVVSVKPMFLNAEYK